MSKTKNDNFSILTLLRETSVNTKYERLYGANPGGSDKGDWCYGGRVAFRSFVFGRSESLGRATHLVALLS